MRKLYIIGLIGLIGITASVALAEELTLTTYYPAPYGVYRQMRTTESLLLQAEPMDSNGPQLEWRTSGAGVERHWNIDQCQDPISTRLRFFTEDNSGDTNPRERVTILENGNVGIGTANPRHPLDVDGNMRFGEDQRIFSTTAANILDATATQTGRLNADSFHTNGLGSGQIYIEGSRIDANATIRVGYGEAGGMNARSVAFGGNVGIGTTSPSIKLELVDESTNILIGRNPNGDSGFLAVDGDRGNVGIWLQSDANVMNSGGGRNLKIVSDFPAYNRDIILLSRSVGIGTENPRGKLDVNGRIYQRGVRIHADYVFEPDYDLESIEQHTEYMWRHKHLKAVPKAKLDENGQEVMEIGAHRRGILEELEKAHLYIHQLNERIEMLEARIN